MTADCLETNGQALAARAVFHHSLITKSTTALKFQGAAALQLSLGRQDEKQILTDYRLVASPFNEPPNLLDLRRLNHSDQILAKALTLLRPVREDYAIAPYTEVFNWEDVLNALRMIAKVEGCTWEQEQTFYIVEFRSKQNPAIDGRYMDLLDYHSHEEAIASGGLLKYWFGEIDEQRRNLATCKCMRSPISSLLSSLILCNRYLEQQARRRNRGSRPMASTSKGCYWVSIRVH